MSYPKPNSFYNDTPNPNAYFDNRSPYQERSIREKTWDFYNSYSQQYINYLANEPSTPQKGSVYGDGKFLSLPQKIGILSGLLFLYYLTKQ